jgi:hypothetical protein
VSSQVMLSPRNSMILTRRVYLDPNVPPSPPHEHNAPIARNSGVSGHLDSEARLKHLSKQIKRGVEENSRFEPLYDQLTWCTIVCCPK